MTSKVVQTRKGWTQSQRALKRLTGREVHVGVVDNAIHDEASGLTNAQLMAIHEYGSPRAGIPERSILRATLIEQRAAIRDLLSEGLQEASTGGGPTKITPTRLLAAAGRLLAKRMRQRFGSGELRPDKVDVGKRGPLLDTGRLRRAIRYKVYDAGAVVAEGGED